MGKFTRILTLSDDLSLLGRRKKCQRWQDNSCLWFPGLCWTMQYMFFFPLPFEYVKKMLRNRLGFLFRAEYVSWMFTFLWTSYFSSFRAIQMSHRQTCWSKSTHSLTESARAVNIWLNHSNWTASHYLWSYLRCTLDLRVLISAIGTWFNSLWFSSLRNFLHYLYCW